MADDFHQEGHITTLHSLLHMVIDIAWNQTKSDPQEMLIPSRNRVICSLPDVYNELRETVEKDNRES